MPRIIPLIKERLDYAGINPNNITKFDEEGIAPIIAALKISIQPVSFTALTPGPPASRIHPPKPRSYASSTTASPRSSTPHS
jgi:hypothetical protein